MMNSERGWRCGRVDVFQRVVPGCRIAGLDGLTLHVKGYFLSILAVDENVSLYDRTVRGGWSRACCSGRLLF